jgi:hypothetical protein
LKILNINYYNTINIGKNYDLFFEYNKYLIIKNIKKTNKGSYRNIKNDSFKRDMNTTTVDKLFNLTVYNGNKECYNKHFNIFLIKFYNIFLNYDSNYNKYPEYINLYIILQSKKIYYDFNYLLTESLCEYESLFDIKTVSTGKKFKFTKKKFKFELSYVFKKKRFKNVLRLVNNYSKNIKFYQLSERLLTLYSNVLLNKQDSFIINRRLYVYQRALQKFYKREK